MAFGYRLGSSQLYDEFDKLQSEINNLFSTASRGQAVSPPLKVYVGQDDMIVMTEIPGVSPDEVTISVIGETLTLGVNRAEVKPGPGDSYHRRERGAGRLSRTIELPFRVDSDKVEAHARHGVLQIHLPRAAEDKPRAIKVRAS
ncbi:MAG: Hsp20/alpha crystallin family protein [Candidatus Lambdaproteobacteria bacterium]|nr:Hsp20/alpha crystallin family protein [Candidatus Lambdaproteobacteria bacterium]